MLVEVLLPEGTSIETTTAAAEKLERWLHDQPEAKIVTSYIGQGAPRFFFAMAPELPDPAFAKIVVLTPDAEAREDLKHRLRQAVSQGLAPEANVRVTQLVFGPYTPFPVEFRVMGLIRRNCTRSPKKRSVSCVAFPTCARRTAIGAIARPCFASSRIRID